MGLNKDVLGAELYNTAQNWNDAEFEDLEAARAAFWKAIAEQIISHLQTAGVVQVPGTGLTAGSNPVTGIATGQIL